MPKAGHDRGGQGILRWSRGVDEGRVRFRDGKDFIPTSGE